MPLDGAMVGFQAEDRLVIALEGNSDWDSGSINLQIKNLLFK